MKNKKMLVILFVFTILFFWGSFTIGKQVIEKTRKAYSTKLVYIKNNAYGFEIQAPENWIYFEYPDGDIRDEDHIMWLGSSEETMFLDVYHLKSHDKQIEDVQKWANQKNRFSDIYILDLYKYVPELDGYLQEHTFVYETMMVKAVTLHCYDVLKTNEGDYFLFQLCEKETKWEEKQEEFWKMLQSIRFD